MKKRTVLIFCCLMLVSLSCQLTSQSVEKITPIPSPTALSPTITPESPTNTPEPTDIPPTKTPLPPTKTPAPTKVPTSAPLVLTDNAFDADIKEACETDANINSFENGVFSFGGGTVSFINGRIALWCYGAKHKWIGTIEFSDYVFASDENDPMQFQIVQNEGYKFIGGVGVLTYPDGKQVSLYRPTKAFVQPIESEKDSAKCQFDEGEEPEIRFESPYTTQAILVDGKLSTLDEWADAFCMDMQFYQMGDMQNANRRYARWYVQHDDDFIYFLILVQKEADITGVAADYFWPVYTGTWAHSDGVYVNLSGSSQDLANWDESDWYNDEELSPPGSHDVEAAFNEIEGFYWFEIKKALNSGDLYDWALKPGDEIGSSPSDSFLFAIITEDSFFLRNLQMKLGVQ